MADGKVLHEKHPDHYDNSLGGRDHAADGRAGYGSLRGRDHAADGRLSYDNTLSGRDHAADARAGNFARVRKREAEELGAAELPPAQRTRSGRQTRRSTRLSEYEFSHLNLSDDEDMDYEEDVE